MNRSIRFSIFWYGESFYQLTDQPTNRKYNFKWHWDDFVGNEDTTLGKIKNVNGKTSNFMQLINRLLNLHKM